MWQILSLMMTESNLFFKTKKLAENVGLMEGLQAKVFF